MTPGGSQGTSRADCLGILVFCLAAVDALVRLVPWSSTSVGTNVDASWAWVYHLVWERPLVCGKDVVFTYGPYGFLQTESYHPATFAARVGIFVTLALLVTVFLDRIVRDRVDSPWARLAWLILLIEAMAVWNAQQNLFYHLDFALLWLGESRERAQGDARASRDAPLEHALAAAAALGSLVKFTLLIGALVPVAVIAITGFLRRRRPPWIVFTFVGSLVAFWLLAGQPLAALAPYFATSAEIAAGYSESMSLPGPLAHAALFVVAGAALLVLFRRVWAGTSRMGSNLRLLGLGALLFLVFKAGFVRYDVWHFMPSVAALVFWFSAALASRPPERPLRRDAVAATAALVPIGLLAHGVFAEPRAFFLPEFVAVHFRAWPEEALAAIHVLTGSTGFDERHAKAVEDLRRAGPLPPSLGAVDVYPALAGIALANGLDYRPRPVIQSYCAFTPHLLRLNAEHLLGPKAPDAILLALADPIDRHMPSMDDGPSWPAFLSRYGVGEVASSSLLLSKRERPSEVSWRPLPGRRIRLGETSYFREPVPGTGLWAEIDLRPTWLGRAASVFFRPPILVLGVRLASGELRTFRICPGPARAGFLLSPLIESNDEYARLASQDRATLASREVRALTISGLDSRHPDWAYADEYDLRLSILEVAR